MIKNGLIFHHLGLATTKKGKAKLFLNGLGYSFSQEIFDPLQNVNLIMCESTNINMPNIELIVPSNKVEKSPLDSIFKKHSEIIYHICYLSKEIEHSLDLVKKDGNRVFTISKPKPAVLFNNRKVGFYHIVGFGLIEILQDEKIKINL